MSNNSYYAFIAFTFIITASVGFGTMGIVNDLAYAEKDKQEEVLIATSDL